MYTNPITIKAVDELSMLSLLIQHNLRVAIEDGWRAAEGVGFSIIGKATLASDVNDVPLAGFFLLIWLGPDVYIPNPANGKTAQQVWELLDGTYKWTGQTIRQLAGVSNYTADVVTRAVAYGVNRKTSFRTPGTPINWYPFTLKSGAPLSTRLTTLVALPTDADVVAADISIPRFGKAREAITTKAQAAAILAALVDTDLKWDRALWRLEKAVEDNPAYDWTTHNFPNVYTP